jgi:RNA polymerase sigma-70 factor (ECF subfamily)
MAGKREQPAAPGTEVDDATLLQAAQDDPAAFAVLYRRHLQGVYRYLLIRSGNEQDAQDLTSQTFLAAWSGRQSYRGAGAVRAWLLRIAWHKLNDHWRHGRTWLPLEAADRVADPGSPVDEQVGHRLRVERVAAALQALSPDRAEALALRLFAGLSASEVAGVMGRSEAAVRMLLHRGLHDLQERLAPPETAERETEHDA